MQVAFFLPQLVQLLRGDSNGMIQRFLFTAAGRSNVFAYNLVCILKVLTAQCSLLLVVVGWLSHFACCIKHCTCLRRSCLCCSYLYCQVWLPHALAQQNP